MDLFDAATEEKQKAVLFSAEVYTDNKDYEVNIINTNKEDLPTSVDTLLGYDEIIMKNYVNL